MRSDDPTSEVREIPYGQRYWSWWRWVRWGADLWFLAVYLILLVALIWWLVSTFGFGPPPCSDGFCQVGDAVAST